MKLKHFDETTGQWIPVAPSQKEFDDYVDSTNLALAEKASKLDVDSLKGLIGFADIRVIVFIVPDKIEVGTQSAYISFPFDGEILEMNSSCAQSGEGDTYIRIEKSNDMKNWHSISTSPLLIPSNSNFDDGSYALFNKNVYKNDIFRANVEQVGEEIRDLTINVKIKVN